MNVVGRLLGSLYDAMICGVARTTGYVMSKSDWKLSRSWLDGLSIIMPSSSTPLALYLSYAFERSGISFLHGGHHVAQKLTTTTLPVSWSCVNAAPVVSV